MGEKEGRRLCKVLAGRGTRTTVGGREGGRGEKDPSLATAVGREGGGGRPRADRVALI